jgi:hypothetical protein
MRVIIFVMRVKNKGILIITSVFVGLIWGFTILCY